MSVHLFEDLEQLCCRVPITDGHGLIGWRPDDFVETAFGPLRAETLGIDHTITWPDGVNALAGIKNRQSFGRINAHQKDGIAVGTLTRSCSSVLSQSEHKVRRYVGIVSLCQR
jgi:hypothetical protein